MNNNYYPNNMYNLNTRSTLKPLYNDFLSMNKYKKATIYMSFPNSNEWKDIIFKGNIEDVQNDYIVIRDINTNKLIYTFISFIDYIMFDE